MPKQNEPRSMGREELLAERIARLRQSSEPPMSYEALATRMAAVGCPIQPSGLHRIEKGNPRRKVSVDELVALAQVFDVSVDELIALPKSNVVARVEEALRAYRRGMVEVLEARDRLATSQQEVSAAERALVGHEKALAGWRTQLNQLAHDSSPLDVTPDEAAVLMGLRREILRALGSGETDRPTGSANATTRRDRS